MSHYFKAQSQKQPTAMGSLLQSSAYGSAIPVGYGMTQSVLLAIWAANLRQGGSIKKFKQFKKGITAYVEDIDFLLGHNPIRNVNQVMVNGSNYPLTFTSQSFASYDGSGTVEITDANFYSVVAVTCVQNYSFNVDDYGGQGPQTLTGSFEVPLWNSLENGPDPSDNSATRNFPYCYSWTPPSYGVAGSGPTVQILDNTQLSGNTLKVYYTKLTDATSFQAPITKLRMFLEAQLGCGNQYSDADLSGQQIIYPQFAGLGSTDIDLGSSGALPQLLPEVAFKWGIYPSGDADFADMIEDVIKSGLAQAALDSTPNYTQQERGLSSYDLPGAVQKKVGNGVYDRPVTQGNFLVVAATKSGGSITAASISDTQGNTWTPIFDDGLSYQAWWAQANASGPDAVIVASLAGSGTFTATTSGATGWGSPVSGSGSCFGMSFLPWSLSVSEAGVAGVNGCPLGNPMLTCTSGGLALPPLPPGAIVTDIKAYVKGLYTGSTGEAQFQINTPSGSHAFTVMDGSTLQTYDLGSDPSILSSCTFEFVGQSTLETTTGYTYGLTLSEYGLEVTYSISEITQFEVAGVDAIDATVTGGASGYQPLTTSNAPGFFGYVMNLGFGFSPSAAGPVPANWKNSLPQANFNAPQGGVLSPNLVVNERIVRNPATLSVAQPLTGSGVQAFAGLSFKATTPNSFPFPLGDFFDRASFDLVRTQCRAFGLWGSLSMTSQSSGTDWLKMLFTAANAAPVYLGNKLYGIPYSEVSTAGNGALYTAPTASGPIAELVAAVDQGAQGDFMEGGEPELVPVDRINLPNVLQLQIIDRENNYNQLSVTQPESATLSLYGMRKADPVVLNCVQDANVARMLLGIMIRRSQYGGDVYQFTLSPRWMLLSPMDLVTLTDELSNIVGVPVRITSCEEQANLSTVCEAEPFIYGVCAPTFYDTTGGAPNPINTGPSAGSVNAPVFLEPLPRMYGSGQPQLWIVVSSGNANYGGSQVYVSTDGGSSYNPLGDAIIGNGITGVTTSDWPAAADPDTTNDLPVDLTECNGVLQSYPIADENAFLYPCFVDGGAGSIPYELMAYAVATLTATSKYTLQATGGGNELRRSVFSAPTAGMGVDHPSGSRFAFLSPAGTGILKVLLDPSWIGTTLYFKIATFNNFGGAPQDLADCTPYTYTPTGVASGVGFSGIQVNGA